MCSEAAARSRDEPIDDGDGDGDGHHAAGGKTALTFTDEDAGDDEDKAEKRLNAYRNAVGDEYGLIGYGANHIAKQVPAAVNKGDMHVAQAAILMHYLLVSEGMVSDRMFLVSSNVKHLAAKDMAGLGIEVIRPGAFVDLLFQAANDRVAEALEQTVSDLTTPTYTKGDLLGSLSLHGAKATVKHFSKAWSVRLPPSKERQL